MALLANIPTQAESLLNSLERVARERKQKIKSALIKVVISLL